MEFVKVRMDTSFEGEKDKRAGYSDDDYITTLIGLRGYRKHKKKLQKYGKPPERHNMWSEAQRRKGTSELVSMGTRDIMDNIERLERERAEGTFITYK